MATKAARKRRSGARKPALRHVRSARDEAVVARLRKLCMAFPEAREKLSHGEPTWFAGAGKVFAILDDHHHGAPHLSVWIPAPAGAQSILIANDPARFWRPPYLGHRGWVAIVLDRKPEWSLVAELIDQAYRLVATPRLVAKLG